MAVEERWPLWGGGRWWRFDCTKNRLGLADNSFGKLFFMVGKGAFTRLASASAPVSVSVCMCRSRSLYITPIDHPLTFGGCNILFLVVFLLSFKSIPLVNAGGRWPFVYDWNPCTKFSEGENCKDVQVSPEKGTLTICLVREN